MKLPRRENYQAEGLRQMRATRVPEPRSRNDERDKEALHFEREFTIIYPGVEHSFTNPDADKYGEKFNLPLEYDAEADEDSWNEMKKFLTAVFK